MDPHFDFLTGVIKVADEAPDEWIQNGLKDFYIDPNNKKWCSITRVLYHESIHFWQVLSSGYIANILADDFKRMEHYISTGEVKPLSANAKNYGLAVDGMPFSTRQLVECWARYWDVHSRGPVAIIEDEGYDHNITEKLIGTDPFTGKRSYSHHAYDFLMIEGPDASLYEAPYKWFMELTNGHSAFVAFTFPILTHLSFACPKPVEALVESFARAYNSDAVVNAINNRSGNINLDWHFLWPLLRSEIFDKVIKDMNLPTFTPGKDVIERGPLLNHCVFRRYLDQFNHLKYGLKGAFAKYEKYSEIQKVMDLENYKMAESPMYDPWILFGLPGQPNYRALLGYYMCPPRIEFSNATLYPEFIAGSQITKDLYEDLIEDVSRFRKAEFAVSKGLPANAFEM